MSENHASVLIFFEIRCLFGQIGLYEMGIEVFLVMITVGLWGKLDKKYKRMY
jgi:hypothetical protein